jgi:benzoate/toluate 1,2-dioxygenase beta subunit
MIMGAQVKFGAARHSHYVTDAFYRELIGDFSNWQSDERAVEDHTERDLFRRLIEKETRFLDRQMYEQWIEMFTDECIYWAPSTPNAGDPRTEIAVMFDDRRRLEDRIYRLRTGYAWSQAPSSRTSRMISNVEVFTSGREEQRMVRCNFSISEFWDGGIRILAGWCGYRFRKLDGTWLISAKQINLINCDQCIRNPSIIL